MSKSTLLIITSGLLALFLSCSHAPTLQTLGFDEPFKSVELLPENSFIVGKSMQGEAIYQGGFSGLQYLQHSKDGNEIVFWTVSDRGPNSEMIQSVKLQKEIRPFLNPEYTPKIFKLSWNVKDNVLKIIDQIPLKDSKGTMLTGLPNMENADEAPGTPSGEPLKYDLLGIDPEGIAQDKNGNFWVVEEYRPSLLKFDSDGNLIKRFVPTNAFSKNDIRLLRESHGKTTTIEKFPEELNFRRQNRGFEGLTIKDNKLIMALQSPLRIPESENKLIVRFFEFDIDTEEVTAMYIYPLDNEDIDKIGDVAWTKDGLYVIEQNSKSGANGVHRIYKVKELVAFDTSNRKKAPELMTIKSLEGYVLKKELVVDLVAKGFDKFDKVEGVTVLPGNQLLVGVDNDFGVTFKKKRNPQIALDPDMKPMFGLF